MIIQEPVQAAIWFCLNNYAYTDAIFLSERLHAEVDSDDSLYLLATSLYRSGKANRAYSVLKTRNCKSAHCRYLMAQCCTSINRWQEAETILTGSTLNKDNLSVEDLTNNFGDIASFVAQILGHIYSHLENRDKAVDMLRISLQLNPFLFSAFEALCNLGEKPDPTKTFQVESFENFHSCQGSAMIVQFAQHSPPAPVMDENAITTLQCTPVQQAHNASSFTNVTSAGVSSVPPIRYMSSFLNGRGTLSSDSTSSIPWATQSVMCTPENGVPLDSSTNDSLGPNYILSPRGGCDTRFQGLKTGMQSPFTPSFGIFPLDLSPAVIPSQQPVTYNSPPLETLIDESKSPSRKNVMTRQQAAAVASGPPIGSHFGRLSLLSGIITPGNNTSMTVSPISQTSTQPPVHVRRSSRLFSNSISVKENNKDSSKVLSSKTTQRRPKSRTTRTQTAYNEQNKMESTATESKPAVLVTQQVLYLQKMGSSGLMKLLQTLGRTYLSLAQYDCKKALECLAELPPNQFNTGWCLQQQARAHFELSCYDKACDVYSEMHYRAPYHLEGLEYYSTALWHLQREVHLAALSSELMEYEKDAPETWCVAGNCMSLQREHETAITYFRRAIQVCSSFFYAYTLLGHEYIESEEMEKAMACFRNATRLNARHYNAWFGQGMIYYKQERYDMAEVFYKRALNITPHNSVILCNIGVVQFAQQETETALTTLTSALNGEDENLLCQFHRASILFSMDKLNEALKEFNKLKEIAPRESLVYFMIGQVHKKLGNTHLALMNFSWAAELDPKGANHQLRETISKRYGNDDEELTSALNDGTGGAAVEDSALFPDDLVNANLFASDNQMQSTDSDESESL